jgi:hypothetical protein
MLAKLYSYNIKGVETCGDMEEEMGSSNWSTVQKWGRRIGIGLCWLKVT